MTFNRCREGSENEKLIKCWWYLRWIKGILSDWKILLCCAFALTQINGYSFVPSFYSWALAFPFKPSGNWTNHGGDYKITVGNLMEFLNNGKAHMKVEMNVAGLMAFSENLIQWAKDELGSMIEEARKERILFKTEVKEIIGVYDAALWHWNNISN